MRQLLFATFLLFTDCTTKKAGSEDSTSNTDTISTSQHDSQDSQLRNEIVQIEFLLDSLLKFDSESELKEVFGDNIKRSIGYHPEGMGEYANTLLYPETDNQVEFVWLDDSISFSRLACINIAGQMTAWKTTEGITLGTNLKELEKINQRPFTFYGFGWDYSGMVNWEEGRLDERKVFVNLEYPGGTIPAEFDELLGDHSIRSDSELAQKANPVVCEITMRR